MIIGLLGRVGGGGRELYRHDEQPSGGSVSTINSRGD
jgi:hypothetical protein